MSGVSFLGAAFIFCSFSPNFVASIFLFSPLTCSCFTYGVTNSPPGGGGGGRLRCWGDVGGERVADLVYSVVGIDSAASNLASSVIIVLVRVEVQFSGFLPLVIEKLIENENAFSEIKF
mmetsp:Transcript_35761/g.26562  ORF Transcript_35761/g.26562 Transcript_35761/m.26562 type:complete len:119 (+) Transcript_35761:221-577(+)